MHNQYGTPMSNPTDIEQHLREIDALVDSERFSELLASSERQLASPLPPGIVADLRRARALAHTGAVAGETGARLLQPASGVQ